jgi:hypothetical protein
MIGWVYHESHDRGVWTVGYYVPPSKIGSDSRWEWVALYDTADEREARRMVNYLNGGDGNYYVLEVG